MGRAGLSTSGTNGRRTAASAHRRLLTRFASRGKGAAGAAHRLPKRQKCRKSRPRCRHQFGLCLSDPSADAVNRNCRELVDHDLRGPFNSVRGCWGHRNAEMRVCGQFGRHRTDHDAIQRTIDIVLDQRGTWFSVVTLHDDSNEVAAFQPAGQARTSSSHSRISASCRSPAAARA